MGPCFRRCAAANSWWIHCRVHRGETNIVGADGINRQVLLLYGSLPAAAMNFILTEKFGQDPHLAASIVVLSTFVSVITIPLVFWLIL
jgi:malate permease and related proteins